MIAKHYSNQLDAFDQLITIRFQRGMRVYSMDGGSSGNNDYNRSAQSADSRANNKKIASARSQLLSFMNGLIELDSTIISATVDTHESDTLFDDIEHLIANSYLPAQWKTVVRSDIENAKLAYRGGAFKGCVVLLGAAIEGLLLGTLPVSYTHLTLPTTPYV